MGPLTQLYELIGPLGVLGLVICLFFVFGKLLGGNKVNYTQSTTSAPTNQPTPPPTAPVQNSTVADDDFSNLFK